MELNQQGETILVVDDNFAIRGMISKLLERAGYAVAIAVDGEDGLDCFRKFRSRIALLLTDVSMPNMNGVDLAVCWSSSRICRFSLCRPAPGILAGGWGVSPSPSVHRS